MPRKKPAIQRHDDDVRRFWNAAFAETINRMAELTVPELRLMLALLNFSRKKGRLTLRLKNSALEKAGNLDDTSLPKARRGLIQKGLIDSEKSGKEHHVIALLDRKGKPAPWESPTAGPLHVADEHGMSFELD